MKTLDCSQKIYEWDGGTYQQVHKKQNNILSIMGTQNRISNLQWRNLGEMGETHIESGIQEVFWKSPMFWK